MEFRKARREDVPAIVRLLADDPLGAKRERFDTPLPEGYQRAFAAIERARERGCHLLQLTTDKARPDAKRFYESLGFKPSHEGMKLAL